MTANEEFITELEKALENENLRDCKLKFSKEAGPNGGFSANYFLAELQGIDNNNEIKTYQVFIKCGKPDEIFKEVMDINIAYEREIYMYSHVFPAFNTFISQRNVSFTLDFVPECYGATSVQNVPVIVLENLGILGYRLNEARYPMTLEHMKMVYGNYAKLHATSFAFKDNKPKQYEQLTKCLTRCADEFWTVDSYGKHYEKHNEETIKLLCESGHGELMQRWKKHLSKGSLNIFKEAMNYQAKETAVIHRDCWNNNFLFQYQGDNTAPMRVKLLDFQVSLNQTPAVDLSAYFYLTCSSQTIEYYEELIEYYYEKFSTYLREFGCDPDKIFPLSTLKRHWMEYSIYPCLLAWHIIHIFMRDKFQNEKFEDMDHPGDLLFKKDYKFADMELYKDRLVSAIKHFCDYQDKYNTY